MSQVQLSSGVGRGELSVDRGGLAGFRRFGSRRVRSVILCVLAAAAGMSWADRTGWLWYQGDDWDRYDGQSFEVAGVVDGDTIEIAARDGKYPTTTVRLWGVDAPEAGREDRQRPPQPYAGEATRRVRTLCQGRTVTLYLQRHRPRGRFGRLLAYVALPGGEVLNEKLLSDGVVEADDRFSHQWVERYAALEQQARQNRLGMWSR